MSDLKLLAAVAFSIMLAASACGGGSDGPTPVNTGEVSGTPSGSVVFCSDQTVKEVADTWVESVTALVEEEPELDLSDVEGMHDDIEAATRKLCEAGQAPPPEAAVLYCDGIIAAIDLRLDGRTTDREAFLTSYYNTCNATD